MYRKRRATRLFPGSLPIPPGSTPSAARTEPPGRVGPDLALPHLPDHRAYNTGGRRAPGHDMMQHDSIPYSLLDLSPIRQGGTAAESFRNSLDLARHAERWGYGRFWLAEHHNL